ncbi:MAG: DNA recombination protein RmuC [Alteromonadaceae bacterium]|nr:DNA recombination protein RmuC [Alteromonadaceae bacterium]RCL48181.1 MAG: DNA recombination protein RmuC [Halieaceae bacterium]
MLSTPLIVALTLIGLSALIIGYLRHRHHSYRESVAEALIRADIAHEEIRTLRQQLADLNQQLVMTSGREEGLKATLATKETEHAEKIALLDDAKKMLRLEFEKTAQALVSQGERALSTRNQESLDQILKPLSQKIDGFQSRVNQVHTDLTGQNAALKTQIKQLHDVGQEMSSEANNLTQALKGDKKLVGNWGETQLERTLELAGLRRGEHYEAQQAFKGDDGQRLLPDFVIYLPQKKHVVIDSKVSLVDYERAITAEDDGARSQHLSAHANAVKRHIDQLSDKDYGNLAGLQSPDFVLMFMPVEPAYIEIMRTQRDLFNYGYRKNVILVSHTTLMPILRTVANLWMVERSNAEAQEISDRAGDIFNAVCLVAERLEGVGASLSQTTKRYNETVKSLVGRQGLHGKVDRFQSLSTRVTKAFPDGLDVLPDQTDASHLSLATDKSEETKTKPKGGGEK